MTPEPLLAPFTEKGKEVSSRILSGIDTGTENRNRWSNLGPMGSGPATSAIGTGPTASGHWKVFARSPATNVRHRRLCAWSQGCGSPIGNNRTAQEPKDHGPGRKVG